MHRHHHQPRHQQDKQNQHQQRKRNINSNYRLNNCHSIAATILFLICMPWSSMKTGTNNNSNNNYVLAFMTAGPSRVIGSGGTQHKSSSRNERNDNDNDYDKDKNQKQIIVVGGGLAGLSVSLGLVKLGYRVHIVERRHDWGKRKGGTYLMQPNAIRALEKVCQEAMDPLYEMGVPVPNSECKMYAWWMVRDSLLKQVMLMNNNISLHMGWSFSDIEDDHPDFIKARFTRTQQTQTQKDDDGTNTQIDNEAEDVLDLTGIMLVGADGVHSAVRASLDLAPATQTGSVCWRGSISITDDDDDDDDDAIDNNNINNARKLLAPLLTSPLLTTGKMVLGYIKCGPYCVVGLKSFHSKYPGVMTWTVNTKEPDAAVKFSHPRDALGAYLDSITKNDNDDDDDDDEENKKTASLIEAVLELADPEELHHSLPFVTIGLPEENQDENANVNVNANGTTGWGGTGRVTLIGDAAHAMRSAGGQGGAMAFEDCVVLARILEQTQALSGGNANDNDKDSDNDTVDDVHHTRASIETAVLEFENSRLPRVRTIWNDQWERAERAYKGDFKPSRTEEDELKYQAWVDKGV
eukprot:CAMPEP_0194357646 /NCGR_PEP_ID=MMETSP0174-20130528/5103_1 /TAXON_ID=216777 /ORGANISM="Proboscia alata, Strain PI-D3" /LENGTH=578 /DNA_ID=CAMNT_0039127759 /DNA_START=131 /DNA_END=1867 /DNA_ORIENTATION=+